MADNLDINTVHKELAKEDFIVFAGTGIVSGTGIPNSWEKLLKDLGDEAGIDVSENCEEDYPDIAQEIYDKLVREGKQDIYEQIIRENLRPTEAPYSVPGMEIADTTNWVVTTNFDNIIEASFKRRAKIREERFNLKIMSLPELVVNGRSVKSRLTYLHGSAHTNHIIFRRDRYDTYYPSVSGKNGPRCLENYLEFIYKERTIVFVGFSFLDKYVRKCFNNIYRRIELQDEDAERRIGYQPILPRVPEHYALIRNPQRKDFGDNIEKYKERLEIYQQIKQDLKIIKIKVVWYENHIDWMKCFEQIRESRKRFKKMTSKPRKRSDAKPIL